MRTHPRCFAGRLFRLVGVLLLLVSAAIWADARRHDAPAAPALMLAGVYRPGIELNAYWVSEKLDGVRAYWDGRNLVSRRGNRYRAPAWFTRGFPPVPLDGELWGGRGRFESLSGSVRKQTPVDAEWRQVRFMVFDLPGASGPFGNRLKALGELFADLDSPYLSLLPQSRVSSHQALMKRLDAVVSAGGEGLMLHRDDAPYRAGRSGDLLKLKPFADAEARVTAHVPGRGKYAGLLGSLEVETPEGKRFRIGTGFSDVDRRHPPPVGSQITYRYRGVTRNGIPRFASFLRLREDF
jgi:DNA ligase-1